MKRFIGQQFRLSDHETSFKKEVIAGTVSFFTIVYIIAVNGAILAEAGIPLQAGMIATILASLAGCLIIGFGANAPLILVPGMGVNALFAYTIVQSLGLSWQEALGAVFLSGVFFALIAFSRLQAVLKEAIPQSLKEAITVGLGLFLTLIGLEKGGIVTRGEQSLIEMGSLSDAHVIATLLTLVIAVILFIRMVPANFLISMAIGTGIATLFGIVNVNEMNGNGVQFAEYGELFAAFSFARIFSVTFWIAVFSLTMVLVFENIGLIHGQLAQARSPEKYKSALRATSVSAVLCGVFGTSPTVSTVESSAGITSGGRTGLTAVVCGALFGLTLFFIPIIGMIPSTAIAPVLIIIGSLMMQQVKHIDFQDLTEGFPAFLVIVMIPFTFSIADGIAFGFVTYPILKLALGRTKEVSLPLLLVAGLFLGNFLLQSFS
ncbi:NCS2 family permease [Bacillus tianshenii]|nr:NCS2 family permease [Bacillus tianshenii]